MRKKIATPDFWASLPGKAWRATCRRLIAIMEFRPKDWLYEQAYPRDRYDTLQESDRYDRLVT